MPLLSHHRNDLSGTLMQAEYIGLELFSQDISTNILNGTGLSIPGIVEPGIDFSLFFQYRLNNSSNLIGFGYIQAHCIFKAHLFEFLNIIVMSRSRIDIDETLLQIVCGCKPDTAAASGNNNCIHTVFLCTALSTVGIIM